MTGMVGGLASRAMAGQDRRARALRLCVIIHGARVITGPANVTVADRSMLRVSEGRRTQRSSPAGLEDLTRPLPHARCRELNSGGFQCARPRGGLQSLQPQRLPDRRGCHSQKISGVLIFCAYHAFRRITPWGTGVSRAFDCLISAYEGAYETGGCVLAGTCAKSLRPSGFLPLRRIKSRPPKFFLTWRVRSTIAGPECDGAGNRCPPTPRGRVRSSSPAGEDR
jgi:hypothetical protein